ncbi:hypothetical protein T03_4855 [Trichinella britovi]|uniref:Uncharacterized protein n=1 Tax=Trichinella britovi TaxID=45882 RepID=A0A0V1C688_TRIBR|nr:hypothetical protein T03_4855 [Trichinella britovi]
MSKTLSKNDNSVKKCLVIVINIPIIFYFQISKTDHKHNTKKRHARLKNGKSSTTRSHVVPSMTTTTLLQYTFDGQDGFTQTNSA